MPPITEPTAPADPLIDALATSVGVHGVVLGPDGAPVAGAVVAAVHGQESSPTHVVDSGADGRFALELVPGAWAFTATSPSGAAACWSSPKLRGGEAIQLELGATGFTVSGELRLVGAAQSEGSVLVTRYAHSRGGIFVVRPAPDGHFAVRLPPAKGYRLVAWAPGAIGSPVALHESRDQSVVVEARVASASPPSAAVVEWIKSAAVALETVEAERGFDDLEAISAMVRGARLVALGEATHGTREFFQMKHRMLEYLVEKEGFTVFAIEANLTEARRVNEYVLHGTGSAAEALAGLYFWTWNTEEVLAMIEWMRRYNLDRKPTRPLQFLGFDMQATAVAWPNVAAYLEKVDPAYAKTLPAGLSGFGDDAASARAHLTAGEREARRSAADAVVAHMDAERTAYTENSSATDFRCAREDARLVAQAAKMFDAQGDYAGSIVRDLAMAENVDWILAQEAPGTKVVLWAHNAHIGKSPLSPNMGDRLAEKHGVKYVAFGFVFAEGAFQAIDWTKGRGSSFQLREFSLGPAPEADVSAAFSRAGFERCIVDLRKAPKGEIADWFAAPHPMRDTGAVFVNEESMTHPVPLAWFYDAIIFVRTTTRARPNGRRPS